MALIDTDRLAAAGSGFNQLSVGRQASILFSIAVSVALGVVIVLWAKEPNLTPLYAQLEPKDVSQVIDALQQANIVYRFDSAAGNVLVPINMVHEVRMRLAALGLPKGAGIGYELLDKPQGFGTSQFMETVQYRRSLEGELSRTIGGLDSVRSARVHLGLPKQSSFLKTNVTTSASVMLDLHIGQVLDQSQIAGIIHLVASSVAGLKKEDVSVVDQRGNLLTVGGSGGAGSAMAIAEQEFAYAKQKERDLSSKIQNILAPVYGAHGVRAEVSAEFDFTFSEETRENFDQDRPTLRSEALVTEQKDQGLVPEGIPGALSNLPPSIANAPELLEPADSAGITDGETAPVAGAPKRPINYRDHVTRNYEVDKTITHERKSIGRIMKLSVAVIVNDKISYDAKGNELKTPLTEDDLAQIESVVKDTIGFNSDRGDTVSIINAAFNSLPPIIFSEGQESSGMDIFNKPWFIPVVKQTLGGIFILLVIFVIIKPMITSLGKLQLAVPVPDVVEKEEPEQDLLELPPADLASKAKIDHVKKITHDDSKKAAQVVMTWLGSEDG